MGVTALPPGTRDAGAAAGSGSGRHTFGASALFRERPQRIGEPRKRPDRAFSVRRPRGAEACLTIYPLETGALDARSSVRYRAGKMGKALWPPRVKTWSATRPGRAKFSVGRRDVGFPRLFAGIPPQASGWVHAVPRGFGAEYAAEPLATGRQRASPPAMFWRGMTHVHAGRPGKSPRADSGRFARRGREGDSSALSGRSGGVGVFPRSPLSRVHVFFQENAFEGWFPALLSVAQRRR